MHKIFNYLAKRFCDNNPIVDLAQRNPNLVQIKSNKPAQPQKTLAQTRRSRRKVLQAQTQPQNGMQMENWMKKTYLILKTLTMEMSDMKTPMQAKKLWWRAIAPRAQMGHWSYLQACHAKREMNCRTCCERHHGGCQLWASHVSASRRQRTVLQWQGAQTGWLNWPNQLKQMWTLTGHPHWAETWWRGLVELMRVTGWSTKTCDSQKQIFTVKKPISTMEMHKKTYLRHMDCHLRGSGQCYV